MLTYDSMTHRLGLAGHTRAEAGAAHLVPMVVEYVREHPGSSQNAVEQGVEGGTAHKRLALAMAVRDGLLVLSVGPRKAKTYRVADAAGRPE